MFACMLRSHVHCCALPRLLTNHDWGWVSCMLLCAFHSTLKLHTLVLWAITHWNARLVVRAWSAMLLWAINMIRSVVGANIAWNALPCHVLPSAAVKTDFAGRFGRPAICSADRPSIRGRYLKQRPVVILHGRWQIPLAGDVPLRSEKQHWELCSLQRRITVKVEATCAWLWLSEQNHAYIAWGPLPKAVYCFPRLVNLLN